MLADLIAHAIEETAAGLGWSDSVALPPGFAEAAADAAAAAVAGLARGEKYFGRG